MRAGVDDGFSLLELLIALAVIALGAALIGSRAATAIAQISDHAAFSDFQRQVLQLRRKAYDDQLAVILSSKPGDALSQGPDAARPPGDPRITSLTRDGEAEIAEVSLPPGWSVTLDPPLRMEASGACSKSSVQLRRGRRRVQLQPADDACHFVRTVAGKG